MSNQGTGLTANLSIEWYTPENLPLKYSTNVTVQKGEHEVFISFFEVVPPLITGTPEYMRERVENLKSIRATCVARIAISSETLPKVIAALQEFETLTKAKTETGTKE